MSSRSIPLATLAMFAGLACGGGSWAAATESPIGAPLPAFTETDADRWINSAPLTVEGLRGQVLLVEFWTFGCGNCVRSIPWVDSLVERYEPRGLVVIGVHTPEFDHERIVERVRRYVSDRSIRHPVVIDNDFDYWRALGNRYWPAFYIADRAGIVRAVHVGETHTGTSAARQVERLIEALLGQPAAAGEPRE